MSDLDQLGRRHAENVHSSLANAEPPPVDSFRTNGRRSQRAMWTAIASAAVVIAVVLPIALLRDGTTLSDQIPVAPSSTDGAEPTTTAETEPPIDALLPFNVESFLASKLAGAFDELEESIAVIVLVPRGAEADVEVLLGESSLPEFEGYTYVPADVLDEFAERFATNQGMEPLDGEWVAYGLIPQFDDSPTGDWAATLSSIPNVKVASVDFDTPTTQIPTGWSVVTDLPFPIAGGAIVGAVDSGIVVLQQSSTVLIGFDGSLTTGDAPPLFIPASCCGGVSGFSTGSSLVLVDEIFATWKLDVDTLTWLQADPRPAAGYVLGTAMIEGELFVVNAASRSGDAISSVAVLDLDPGTWMELEPVPSPISVGGVTTNGNRLVVAGTRQGPNNNVIGDRSPSAYQYTPGEGWSELPDIPIDGQASTVAWVEGAGLLAWNYGLESALLDQSGAWRELDNVPMSPAECYPKSFPTVTGVAGLCGGIALFDAATESWHTVRHPFDTRYVVTDTSLFGLVQSGRDQSQMIVYPITHSGS